MAIRRLTVIGIVLPVAFIISSQAYELAVIERFHPDPGQLALCSVVILAVLGFGTVMFFLVEQAHRVILQQNQAMIAANSVFAAIRGDLGVDQIVDAALDDVLALTGAVRVAVTAPAHRQPTADDVVTWEREAARESGPPTAPARPDAPSRVLDIPLLSGSTSVGAMLLHLGADSGKLDWLDSRALRGIGQQLGSTIQHTQLIADLQRRKHEGHALYDLLLQISNQTSAEETLRSVVSIARDQLHADDAVLCVAGSTVGFRPAGRRAAAAGDPVGSTATDEPVCVVAEAVRVRTDEPHVCPKRRSPAFQTTISVRLCGPVGPYGELWLGRSQPRPFTRRDRRFLDVLAELAVVAITHTRILDSERHAATLAERDRIAREMHDSLAQVLGATHLRLRELATRQPVPQLPQISAELSELADTCHEAYGDVREAILGLREASRADRPLLEALREYVVRFARRSGIETRVVSDLDHEPALTPRCEVQVIRVVQEALTNVRKHSGAASAVIRVSATAESTIFVVEDDGHGFAPAANPADQDGFGLHAMRERMRLVSGSLTIDSVPGRGTRIVIAVPAAHRMPASPPAKAVS